MEIKKRTTTLLFLFFIVPLELSSSHIHSERPDSSLDVNSGEVDKIAYVDDAWLEDDGNVIGGQANDVEGPNVWDITGCKVDTWANVSELLTIRFYTHVNDVDAICLGGHGDVSVGGVWFFGARCKDSRTVFLCFFSAVRRRVSFQHEMIAYCGACHRMPMLCGGKWEKRGSSQSLGSEQASNWQAYKYFLVGPTAVYCELRKQHLRGSAVFGSFKLLSSSFQVQFPAQVRQCFLYPATLRTIYSAVVMTVLCMYHGQFYRPWRSLISASKIQAARPQSLRFECNLNVDEGIQS